MTQTSEGVNFDKCPAGYKCFYYTLKTVSDKWSLMRNTHIITSNFKLYLYITETLIIDYVFTVKQILKQSN